MVKPALTDRYLSVAETAELLGLSTSTIWRNVKAGLLPAPVYVSKSSPRWRLSQLNQVLNSRQPGSPLGIS